MRMPLVVFLACTFAGCAGYQIGPVQPTFMQGIESIAVPTFRNETLEPRVEMLLANTVIKQLQQDGTYRVASTDDADAVLEGTIIRINRRPTRSVRGFVLATREFELNLTIGYNVISQTTGEIISSSTVTGTTNFFVSGDIEQDERQALPLAAEEAAVRLVSQISEGW
jgi:hypothetical protein